MSDNHMVDMEGERVIPMVRPTILGLNQYLRQTTRNFHHKR